MLGIEKALQSGQKSIEDLDKYEADDKLYEITIENHVRNCPTIVVNEAFNRELAKIR